MPSPSTDPVDVSCLPLRPRQPDGTIRVMAVTRNPAVDAYIEQAADFAKPLLVRIRAAFHKGCPDLEEQIKWSVPHFVQVGERFGKKGAILGGMAAFKAHVSIGFWKAAQMPDPEKLMTGIGDSCMSAIRVTSTKDLPKASVLVDYVRAAARVNEKLAADDARSDMASAAKVSKDRAKNASKSVANRTTAKSGPALHPDFAKALRTNKAAKSTLDRFSPSHRRDYLEWIAEAKRDETRAKRIATAIEWLAEGKHRNWKYERR